MAVEVTSKEMIELFSDLIKIGIPSIIALVGVVFSFVLAIKGHKKDLLIENLRAETDVEKERNSRKGELIQDISLGISQIHTITIKYGTKLSAKIETEESGEIFPDKNRIELSSIYDKLNKDLHIGIDVKAKVYLLGNAQVIKSFQEYWSSITEFSMSCSPGDQITYKEVGNKLLVIGKNQESVYSLLSNIYLLAEVSSNEIQL